VGGPERRWFRGSYTIAMSTKCSTTLATLTTSAGDQTPSGVVRFAGAFLSLSFRPFAAERAIFIGRRGVGCKRRDTQVSLEGGGKAAAPPERRQTRDGCCIGELKLALSLIGLAMFLSVWLYGCWLCGLSIYQRMRMICVRCDDMTFIIVVIASPCWP
jgi:hypothetical protein